MKNTKFLFIGILPLLFLLPFPAKAQAPGYLGKKFYVNLTTGFGAAIKGPTQNNRGYEDILGYDGYGTEPDSRGLGINFAIDVAANYVVARNGSLGLTVGQYTTGVLTNLDVDNSVNYDNRFDNLHELKVRSIGLRYTWFRTKRGALAPVGRNFYLGLERSVTTGEIIDQISISGFPEEFDFPDLDQNINSFFVSMGFQKNTILFDKVLLNFGFSMRLPIATPYTPLDYFDDSTFSLPGFDENPNQTKFEFAAQRRIILHGLFRIEIGVGYLLF